MVEGVLHRQRPTWRAGRALIAPFVRRQVVPVVQARYRRRVVAAVPFLPEAIRDLGAGHPDHAVEESRLEFDRMAVGIDYRVLHARTNLSGLRFLVFHDIAFQSRDRLRPERYFVTRRLRLASVECQGLYDRPSARAEHASLQLQFSSPAFPDPSPCPEAVDFLDLGARASKKVEHWRARLCEKRRKSTASCPGRGIEMDTEKE